MEDINKLGVDYPDMSNRKISVSFVSEVAPTCNSIIDPTQAFGYTPDPTQKHLQQKVIRIQVVQVVLGLMLMVLSGVALIEERTLLGVGFGLISALLAIVSAAVGIQQCELKVTSILNLCAFIGLLPTFYFSLASLVEYSKYYFWSSEEHHDRVLSGHHNHNMTSQIPDVDVFSQKEEKILNFPSSYRHHEHRHGRYHDNSSVMTMWTLSWLELFHLLPLATSILYLLVLYRHLKYYPNH